MSEARVLWRRPLAALVLDIRIIIALPHEALADQSVSHPASSRASHITKDGWKGKAGIREN